MITIEQVIEQCALEAERCDGSMHGVLDRFMAVLIAGKIRALAKQYEGCIVFGAEPVVSAGLARTLERELAAMTERGQKAEAERDALRSELLSIGDLDKRHAIARESGLAEWADWAQNRARHAALKEPK